jgi:hypothetical protein
LDKPQQTALAADATLLLNKIPLLRKQPDSRKNILAAGNRFFYQQQSQDNVC